MKLLSEINYKQIGVYCITNTIDKKKYFGESITIKKRYNYHKNCLASNTHPNTHLQNSVNKYGMENFTFELVEEIEDRSKLLEVEHNYCLEFDTYSLEKGFNKNRYDTQNRKRVISDNRKQDISKAMKGKVIVNDSDGNRYKVSTTDTRYLSGELVALSKNRVSVKDSDGNTLSVHINDTRYLSGELVSVAKDTIIVKDSIGNNICVSNDDPRYLSGELVSIHKNKITVKDKEGNVFKVNENDPRYLSGELVGSTKGLFSVMDKNGNKLFVPKNDIRVLSGELFSTTKGNIGWSAIVIIDEIEKRIKFWAEDFSIKLNDFPKYCKENNINYQWKNPKNKKFDIK